MIGVGYLLFNNHSYRKNEPMNYYLLATFTGSTALFLISWTAMINVFAVCCQILGGFIAVSCCYLAARQIASTKNRDDT